MKKDKFSRDGFTMTEIIAVLLIIAVLAAIAVPSLSGYIRKTKIQRYKLEAQGVFYSIQLYMLDKYKGGEIDYMDFVESINTYALTSKRNELYSYLTVKCTRKAQLVSFVINDKEYLVHEIVYVVDNYQITVHRDETIVVDLRK